MDVIEGQKLLFKSAWNAVIEPYFIRCLVLGKYQGKKKNAEENSFLMFGYTKESTRNK